MQKIESLPDYPALRQAQNALWRIGEVHGAAVMIGAGFSQFADRTADTTPLAPLWSDFQEAMLHELYPEGGGPSDPLALAEEYQTTLGPPALENLIRRRVRDEEWSPGGIHRRLLSLPWSDVLTTNWDTLLERSADSNPEFSFDIVRVPTDIARTRSPRIVKLHGSLPSLDPFIFTEEDFRTYPNEFAPFANLARQVLLENELCLLGFSGDDPNFLQWSGWVRDQLGPAARPIRLVGVLDLSPSRRRLLEGRNITPIDLAPLVVGVPKEDRHRRAVEIFLDCLDQGKPPKAKWLPTLGDQAYASLGSLPDPDARLTRLTEIWAQDRKAHPGWLVTPSSLRADIRRPRGASESCKFSKSDLDSVSKPVKAALLYETIWRWEIAFWPPPGFVEDAVSNLVATSDDNSLPLNQQILLRVAIVRAARRRRDWKAFDKRIQFLDALSNPDADLEALYERCLRARDELDYTFVAANAKGITGHDPIWLLRRAALMAEIQDSQTAAKLIYEAHGEIRRRRAQDRRSLWLLSREAWASWLMQHTRFALEEHQFDDQTEWPLAYKIDSTDPWDELQQLDSEIERTDRQQRDAMSDRHPQFDAGAYWVTRFFNTAATSPYDDITRLMEHVGIPLKLDMFDLLMSRFKRAVQVSEDDSPAGMWASVRAAIAGGDSGLIDVRFSRVAVAGLSIEDVSDSARRLRSAIEFGQNRLINSVREDGSTWQGFDWVGHVSNLIELLSRFTMRFQGNAGLDLFLFGVSLAHDPHAKHPFLLESLGNFLRRSLQALEPERRGEVALDVLRLPLMEDPALVAQESSWIEIFDALGKRAWRVQDETHEWSAQIASLIKVIADGSGKPSRRDATYRLFKLFEAGALTEDVVDAFGDALWRHTGNDGFPANTSLLPHVFLKLPSPDPDAPRRVFDAKVVKKLSQGSFSEDLLNALVGASYPLQGEYKPYTLDPEDAQCILDHALNWELPANNVQSTSVRLDLENNRIANLIGRALASTVLPSLSSSLIGADRTRALMNGALDVSRPAFLMALPVLVKLDETIADEVIKVLQQGLITQRLHDVRAALTAVIWFERFAKQTIIQVPDVLVSETVSICLMRREPGLDTALHCVRRLTRAGVVSTTDQSRLADALALLRTETNYKNWLNGSRSSEVGLIRAAAVRLAAALKDVGGTGSVLDEWVAGARDDPMPEVRYALSLDQEN